MTDMLDLATIFRVSALFYLWMSLTTWLVLRRQDSWPLRLWCLGGWLTAGSAWLISLRGVVSDVWTYPVAQPMLLAAYLIYAQALRMGMGRPWPWKAVWAALLLYAGIMACGHEYRLHWGMSVFVRCINSLALLALTRAALDLAQHERSRNAAFIAAGFGLFTVSMLANVISTWLGQSALHALQTSAINHVMGVVSLLTLIMSYMGYLGLALERAQRENLGLRQTQWQENQWREQAQALTQLDRQRTLTMLANSLGHGIVQPLAATRLNVELAAHMAQSDTAHAQAERVTQVLRKSVEGLESSAAMIERIRAFLRPAPNRPTLLSLQTVLQDAHDLLRQELIYRGIDLTVRMPEQPVRMHGELLPLTQALVQVLRNAMDAVSGQRLRTIALVLSVTEGQACIEVTDSGPGFPARVLEQANAGAQPVVNWQGGLGLYMTKGILTQSGGRLSLDNLPSGGARVRLSLPLIQA